MTMMPIVQGGSIQPSVKDHVTNNHYNFDGIGNSFHCTSSYKDASRWRTLIYS